MVGEGWLVWEEDRMMMVVYVVVCVVFLVDKHHDACTMSCMHTRIPPKTAHIQNPFFPQGNLPLTQKPSPVHRLLPQ